MNLMGMDVRSWGGRSRVLAKFSTGARALRGCLGSSTCQNETKEGEEAQTNKLDKTGELDASLPPTLLLLLLF